MPHRRTSQSLLLKNKKALFSDACSKILTVCQTVIGPSVTMPSLVREMGLLCAVCAEEHLSLPAASTSQTIVYTTDHCVHCGPLCILWTILYTADHRVHHGPFCMLWTIVYTTDRCVYCGPLCTRTLQTIVLHGLMEEIWSLRCAFAFPFPGCVPGWHL